MAMGYTVIYTMLTHAHITTDNKRRATTDAQQTCTLLSLPPPQDHNLLWEVAVLCTHEALLLAILDAVELISIIRFDLVDNGDFISV